MRALFFVLPLFVLLFGAPARAGRCGALGRACCTRGAACSSSDLVCLNGTCEACGTQSAPCCAGSTCSGSGLACQNGYCQTCGVSYGPCCAGSTCNSPYTCVSNTCLWHCADGIVDAGETDVDCGGGTGCPSCGTGKHCNGGGDCASGVCSGTCQAPSCSDGVKNGAETAIDCGGGTCPTCADGQVCATGYPGCIAFHNDYCQSGCCVGALLSCNSSMGGVCGPSHCCNGALDGNETDIDCGGTSAGSGCGLCVAGKMCADDWDCTSSACVGNVCQ